jgi:ABC-type Fe3+/spermidine/putrescine transport system ATPase subunit
MVTHDQEEALSLSDRIAVIDRGCIEQIGRPSDIYERPINCFVAGFIGGTNLVPGMVREANDEGLIVETPEGFHIKASPNQKRTGSGDQIFVAIRPEKIHLTVDPQTGAENQLHGVIENIVYMGASTTFHIRVQDRRLVVVEKSAEQEVAFSKNQAVFLTWARSATRALSG